MTTALTPPVYLQLELSVSLSWVLRVNTLELKLYVKPTSRHYNVRIVSYSQYGCCMSAESVICV